MRTCILLTAFILLHSIQSYAQDTLMLRNGDELSVSIINIQHDYVLYRNAPPDTIVRFMEKEKVFMVKFRNGTKYVVGDPSALAYRPYNADSLQRKKLEETYKEYQHIIRKRFKGGVTFCSISGLLMLGGGGLLTAGLIRQQGYSPSPVSDTTRSHHYAGPGILMIGVGSSMIIVGGIMCLAGGLQLNAIRKYKRKSNEIKALLSFEPSLQPIPRAGNIYGSAAGVSMHVTF